MKKVVKKLRTETYLFNKEFAFDAVISHVTGTKWPEHYELQLEYHRNDLAQEEFSSLEEIEAYIKEYSKTRFFELKDGMPLNFKFYKNRFENRYFENDDMLALMQRCKSCYYYDGKVFFFETETAQGNALIID